MDLNQELLGPAALSDVMNQHEPARIAFEQKRHPAQINVDKLSSFRLMPPETVASESRVAIAQKLQKRLKFLGSLNFRDSSGEEFIAGITIKIDRSGVCRQNPQG